MSADPTQQPPRRGRALVTGASSGIGAALARRMLEAGFDLVVTGRRLAPLEAVRARGTAHGREVRAEPCDLASPERSAAFCAGVIERGERFRALVLNAAANGKTPLGGDGRAFAEQLEVNLAAPLRLLRSLIPHVEEGGRVLVIASVLARVGIPHYHGYCATKAGLVGLARALALDLAPRRIAVSALMPGWTETPMAARSMREQAPDLGLDEAGARAHFLQGVPLGRMLQPEEIADSALHLLGPAGAGFTGQALVLDGGALA